MSIEFVGRIIAKRDNMQFSKVLEVVGRGTSSA